MHRPRSFARFAVKFLAGLVIVLGPATALAECPPGDSCASPDYVAFETGGGGCDTMNGQALTFNPIAAGSGGTQILRACYCATDHNHPEVDASDGVEFLKVILGGANKGDFTVLDSGYVKDGVTSGPVPGDAGCYTQTFTEYSGCLNNNPQEYCFADIEFNPSPQEVGTLTAYASFNTECPGADSNPVPSYCLEYIPLNPDLVLNYTGSPVGLAAEVTGFGILQPESAAPFASPIAMSTPSSTTDPGSAQITFQAQVPSADATATVRWNNMLVYHTSKGARDKKIKTVKANFTTAGEGVVTETYSGEGGWWCITADLQSASDHVSLPVTGNNPPESYVCSLLNSLCTSCTTTDLLPKLANTESGQGNSRSSCTFCGQFSPETLDEPKTMCGNAPAAQYTGLWPTESNYGVADATPGLFVGMMQVPTAENTAWDWTANAKEAWGRYNTAHGYADHYWNNPARRKKYSPELPALTGQNLDGEALGRYKGFKLDWYLVPQCSTNAGLTNGTCPSGGSWNWVQNPNPCTTGGSTCSNAENVVVQVTKVFGTTDPCTN